MKKNVSCVTIQNGGGIGYSRREQLIGNIVGKEIHFVDNFETAECVFFKGPATLVREYTDCNGLVEKTVTAFDAAKRGKRPEGRIVFEESYYR